MFDEQVAIVTGGASGIGRAAAERFAGFGARVVVADINIEAGEELVHHIVSNGGDAKAVRTDVREPDQISAMVDETLAVFGRIDVLVNNAADLSLLAQDDHLLNTDPDIWEKTFRANQLSAMVATKCVLPTMLARQSGAIVNISSVDGMSGDDTRFAYGMSKAALNQLTMMVATGYGKQGIRCNAVAPGLVLTPAAEDGLPPPVRQVFDDNSLVPAFGAEPSEVAAVITFLASEDASFINGEVIRVDGGLLSHVSHLAGMRSALRERR